MASKEQLLTERLGAELERKRDRQVIQKRYRELIDGLREGSRLLKRSGDPSYAVAYVQRAAEQLLSLERLCLESSLSREEWWGTFVASAAGAVKSFHEKQLAPTAEGTPERCWCGVPKIRRNKNRVCPVHRPGVRGDPHLFPCGHPRGKSSRCPTCRRIHRPSQAKPIPGLESDAFKVAEYLAKEFDRKVALNTGVPVCKFCAEFKTERLYQFQQKGRYYTRRAFVCYCRRPDLLERAESAKLPNSLFEKLR